MEENFNPKVSIIIPVYNGSRYLGEAIDSALAQTYRNIEVIVVNDGSTDDGATEAIALAYGERIRYYAKENGGVSTALNRGIQEMTGEYFSWLSHDDVYYPTKIESQITFLRDSGPKDAILYGGYELIDASSQVLNPVKPELIYPEEKLNLQLFPILKGLINGCTLLIAKSHFERGGGFDETLLLTQDYALWFTLFRGATVRFLPGIFVKTRIHDQQNSTVNKECTLAEGNRLWISLIDKVSVEEMCEMDGSPSHFYRRTAEFLKRFTEYREALQHAQTLAQETKEKISVIIPFYNRVALLMNAVQSVLKQTYPNLEVLLIDDGTTEDLTPLQMIRDSRLRYVYQPHQGASAARNLGVSLALGDYIAFLDSDDIFHPQKLDRQKRFMDSRHFVFSHTSYQRATLEGRPRGIISSGRFSGQVYPKIIASCGIATSTVLLKRELLNGKRFKEDLAYGEDVCLWIDLASSHPIGGLDEPLTQVRIGRNTSAYNRDKQRIAYLNIADHVIHHPAHCAHEQEIHQLLTDFRNLFQPKPGRA